MAEGVGTREALWHHDEFQMVKGREATTPSPIPNTAE